MCWIRMADGRKALRMYNNKMKERYEEIVRALPEQARVAGFRAGVVMQAIGSMVALGLHMLGNQYFPYAVGVFEVGILLTILTFVPNFHWSRKALLAAFLLGVLFELPAFAGIGFMFFFGLGLVLFAGAGVYASHAYRYRHIEGWVFLFAYAALVIPNFKDYGSEKLLLLMGVLVCMLHLLMVKKVFSIKEARHSISEPAEHSEGLGDRENEEGVQ